MHWPSPNGRAAGAALTGDVEDGRPVSGKQNDLGALNVLLRTIAIVENRAQESPVIGPEKDINGLCHSRRIAWIGNPVNRLFGSEH